RCHRTWWSAIAPSCWPGSRTGCSRMSYSWEIVTLLIGRPEADLVSIAGWTLDSHSTTERVQSIGKDGNNGSQGQTTRHEQVAGGTPRLECPLPRRVRGIPARTQPAVGGGGRTPAAERAGRRPPPAP